MTDKPILFSGPMIRALLDGRKSQTRRVLKPQPPSVEAVHDLAGIGYHWFPPKDPAQPWRPVGPVWAVRKLMGREPSISLPYAPGDRLWIREAWSGDWFFRDTPPSERQSNFLDGSPHDKRDIWYWADGNPEYGDWERPRPSIHMPRWASRLTLIVTDVRVQRVQEISGEDCIAEGAHCDTCTASWSVGRSACNQRGCFEIRQNFRTLWDSLNADRGFGWEANPWVSATTFTVHKCNIDQMEAT